MIKEGPRLCEEEWSFCMNGECCQSYWVWIVVLYLYVKREYLAGVFWGLRGSLASVTPLFVSAWDFLCVMCVVFLILFSRACVKRERVWWECYVLLVKCWDDVWCQRNTCRKSVFPLQWSLGMRWCHQSSVDVIEKKCLVVPSFAKVKTHTEVKLWLVQNKTMTLFLRC